jgi:hypothetical protein
MSLAVTQTTFSTVFFTPLQVTFPSATTPGTLLIVFFHADVSSGSFGGISADWTVFAQDGSGAGSDTFYGVYRYAVSGDGDTPPAISNGNVTIIRSMGMEISGVSGTFFDDFQGYQTSAGYPTTGPTTTDADSLAVIASGNVNGGSIYTPSAGWTNDQANTTDAATLDHILLSSIGSSTDASPSWNSGSGAGYWITSVFKPASGGGGGSTKNRLVTFSFGM